MGITKPKLFCLSLRQDDLHFFVSSLFLANVIILHLLVVIVLCSVFSLSMQGANIIIQPVRSTYYRMSRQKLNAG